MSLSLDRLKSVLSYDVSTGVFLWVNPTSGRMKPGQRAGRQSPIGYRAIQIDGQRFYEHRLAIFFMTGEWPLEVVDHINRDRCDNRYANLREATVSQNTAHAKLRIDNTSGLKGVSATRSGNFTSFYSKGGKTKYLGTFGCPAAAHLAYIVAASEAHGAAFVMGG